MKTDYELGRRVAAYLEEQGLETPRSPVITGDGPEYAIAEHFTQIMQILGLDLTNDSLSGTPARMAKLYVREIFAGLNYGNFPACTVIENERESDEMVVVRNIAVNSTCEHHLLPIVGKAHVAYIPGKKILGLSKFNRVVEFFCARPQVQERLVLQIHSALSLILDVKSVAVVIEAEHLCVKTRGVQDGCSDTVTSRLSGAFVNPETRAEFFNLIRK